MIRPCFLLLWLSSLLGTGCYLSHRREAADAALPADAGRRDAGPRDAAGIDAGPIEICNREDDDADGFVDEDLLRVGPRTPIRPLLRYRYNLIPGEYHPDRRELGVLLATTDDLRTTHELGRLDPATGELLGPLVPVATGIPGFPLSTLIYDGRHWTVAVSGERLELHRIDSTTRVATRITTIEGNGVPSLARLGTSGSDIAVAWTTATSEGRLTRLALPEDASAPATPLGPDLEIAVPGGYVLGGRVVGTPTGALVIFYVSPDGSAPYQAHVATITATDATPFTRRPELEVGGLTATYEPASGLIGAAFSCNISGECLTVFHTFDPTVGMFSPPLSLGGPLTPVVQWAGEPGQLAVFSGMFVPTQGQLVRIRVADRAVVPEPPIAIDGFSGMVPVPEGPGRFVYFEDDSTTLYAFPITCP